MGYRPNPYDPFADDGDTELVVPPDRREQHVTGTRAIFIEVDPPDASRWHRERVCLECDRVLVIPDGYPTNAERLHVVCPARHYSTTITVPDGFTLGG